MADSDRSLEQLIGAQLRGRRCELGWLQEELAIAANYHARCQSWEIFFTRQRIGNIENGIGRGATGAELIVLMRVMEFELNFK